MAKVKKSKSKRNLTLPVIAAVVLLAALAVLVIPRGGGQETLAEDRSLTIPAASITETASFYPVVVDGTEMEVLAIRTASGEIRTAFNTCQSCYTSGHGYYVADGTELVCQNCGFRFTAEEVGLEGRGGCNPWPIPAADRAESEEGVAIPYEVLAEGKTIFSNWSKP
ncbi:MAG: DUF2318 domain-containing protein [Oscillospiraceae bacterium]|nr:DUF2318 domain-containing protein [Oscillospiraceae bacterium]